MNADQVKELLSNATPGPWNTSRKDIDTYTCREDGQRDHVVYVYRNAVEKQPRIPVFAGPLDNARADAALIAAAPDIAALAIAQAAEIERLRGALRSVLEEAWDGQTAYAVDAGTLAKASIILQESETLFL